MMELAVLDFMLDNERESIINAVFRSLWWSYLIEFSKKIERFTVRSESQIEML